MKLCTSRCMCAYMHMYVTLSVDDYLGVKLWVYKLNMLAHLRFLRTALGRSLRATWQRCHPYGPSRHEER